MNEMAPLELARKFLVDDLPRAEVPFTRIQGILAACAAGKELSSTNEAFLRSRGLLALVAFAKGDISEALFFERSLLEQQTRTAAADEGRLQRIRQAQANEARMQVMQAAVWAEQEEARLRAERDPRNIARRKARALRERFGVYGYVDQAHYLKVMEILHCLVGSRRLPEADFAWLAGVGRDYRTDEILATYHRLEADHYLKEWKSTGNIWSAVSASSHLRKCNASLEAHVLLSAIPGQRLTSAKLKSACMTTHGGAMRDLQRYGEAKVLALEAHATRPSDYRPCTLLGALHIELGLIGEGDEWYRKAEGLGAPAGHVESELRTIVLRLAPAQRASVVNELITADPIRYHWLLHLNRAAASSGTKKRH